MENGTEDAANGAAEQNWAASTLLRDTPLGAIIKVVPGAFYVIDRDGRFILWNSNLEQVSEMTPGQLRQVYVPDLFSEPDRARIEHTIQSVFDNDEEIMLEATLVAPSGRTRNYLLSAARIQCQDQAYLCGIGLDLTQRRQQESLLRLRERALHAASNGILITRCAGKDSPIEYINPAFERITGYNAAESMGRAPRFMAAPGLDDGERGRLRDAISERSEASVVFRNLRKDGTLFWNELSITPVLDEQGVATHYIGIINDITAVKQRTSHLEHRLNHDSLTGLANRNLLWDRLEQALHVAQRNKTLVATVMVDLNKFKQINDTYGHGAGDVVLTSVARRMQASVRDTDTVARLSGDEFVLVLANQPSLRYTLRMLERLREGLAKPVALNSTEIPIGASLGVSVYPHDGDVAADLIKAADTAMYHAKSAGSSEVYFYSAAMKSSSDAKRKLEDDMRAALDNGEFFLLFQPRLCTRSGAIPGVEVALRWRHPEQGVLAPAAFMAEAEENGMVRPISRHVLELVLGFMADMRNCGHAGLQVALNASYREFSQQDYVGHIRRRLGELNLPPGRLELELNEHCLQRNPPLSLELTRQIRDAGIELALGEFGNGLSCLGALPGWRPAHLKINLAAVDTVPPRGDHGTLARVLIEIGHALDVQVIGSGVETEAQAALLRQHGCDQLQGSYVSNPLAACALKQLLDAAPQ